MGVDPSGEDPIGAQGGVEDGIKFCKGHLGNRNLDQLHTIGNNGGVGRQYWFHPHRHQAAFVAPTKARARRGFSLQRESGSLGFRVEGLGFRVWGLGFRVWGAVGVSKTNPPRVLERV